MELQTVTLGYKRGPRQECICHDDVYAVSSLENDLMKILGRVKVGQPGAVERGTRQMKPVTCGKRRQLFINDAATAETDPLSLLHTVFASTSGHTEYVVD